MTEIKFETKVSEAAAGALPQLRPFVGRRVELIAHDRSTSSDRPSISLGEFLEMHRLEKPADRPTVTLEDMENAIARGASGGDL